MTDDSVLLLMATLMSAAFVCEPQPTVLGFRPADYAFMFLMGAVAFAAQFANNRGAELLPAAVSGTISTLQARSLNLHQTILLAL